MPAAEIEEYRVRHDPDRMLTVEAGRYRISDIGTRFVVNVSGGGFRTGVSQGTISVVAQAALRSLAERLAEALPQGGDVLRAMLRDAPDPGALADLLAASVVIDPEERQQLIEILDVSVRLARVSDAVAELVRRLSPPQPRGPLN